jgi:hypothetical protein
MDDTYWLVAVATVLIVAVIWAGAYATRPHRHRQRRDF